MVVAIQHMFSGLGRAPAPGLYRWILAWGCSILSSRCLVGALWSCFSIFSSGKEMFNHFQHHERVRCTLKLHCSRHHEEYGAFPNLFSGFAKTKKGFLQKLASPIPGTKQWSWVSTRLCYKPEVALSWCIWYIVIYAPSGCSSLDNISLKWRRIHSKGVF